MLTEFAPVVWLVFATGMALALPYTVIKIRANASDLKIMLPVLLAVTATFLAALGASFLSHSLEQMEINQVNQGVVMHDGRESL